MKNLKLLSLLGVATFSLLSFTYLNEVSTIKDGTYKSIVTIKYLTKAGSNPQRYMENDDKLSIKIENERITEINSKSKLAINNNKLIGLALQLDNNGNATVETSDYVYNSSNRNNEGTYVEYKVMIKKEELTK